MPACRPQLLQGRSRVLKLAHASLAAAASAGASAAAAGAAHASAAAAARAAAAAPEPLTTAERTELHALLKKQQQFDHRPSAPAAEIATFSIGAPTGGREKAVLIYSQPHARPHVPFSSRTHGSTRDAALIDVNDFGISTLHKYFGLLCPGNDYYYDLLEMLAKMMEDNMERNKALSRRC